MAFWFTFFLWVASFVLQDYFRPRLPRVTPDGAGDFKVPTATQGRPIPQVAGGTVRVEGPNCVWYGDWDAEPVTVETGIIFKRDETVGYSYRIATCMGQFIGESAGMTAIYIGDDKVWDYVVDNGGAVSSVVDVDLPDLFGGDKNGGGFRGRFRAFTGQDDQAVSAFMASRITNQSAWPGMTYVVMTNSEEPVTGPLNIPFGSTTPETKGALIGESNQLRDIRIEFQCFDTIANGGLGNDLGLSGDRHFIGRDANPIAAAYRILTHPDWSLTSSVVDAVNFQTAAITCYNEGIGYSLLLDSEAEAFEVLAEIEKHIDGYIGPNPVTGLIEVVLARDDYTPASEFQADDTNIIAVTDFAKPDWPQTKNDVKVRFINRANNYNDDHAVAQDMANRIITGRPSPITIRFPGVREPAVANIIVARTSRAYFWPLAKFKLELDRENGADLLRPGSVVIVTNDDIGVTALPCRVTRISDGDPVKQSVKADLVEDVFRVETGLQANPPDSDFIPPANAPVTPTVFATMLSPRWMLLKNEQTLEPRVVYMVERDAPNSAGAILWNRRTTFGTGTYGADVTETLPTFSLAGTLRANLGQLVDTANDGLGGTGNGAGFSIDGVMGGAVGGYSPQAEIDGIFVINPGAINEEIVAVRDVNPDATGVVCTEVFRGIGDTAILEHTAGEPVFFLDDNVVLQENQGINAGNGYRYKIGGTAFGNTEDLSLLAYEPEIAIENRHLRPPPPWAMRLVDLNASSFFAAGTLNAVAGLTFDVLQRRGDTDNPVYAADGRDDNGSLYVNDAFSDYLPQFNLYVYDITVNGAPVSPANADGDAVFTTSFTVDSAAATLIDRDEEVFLALTSIQGILVSGNTHRLEWTVEYQNTVGDFVAGVESRSVWFDRDVTYPPASLSYEAIEDTILLIHGGDGEAGTNQILDYSKNAWTVTPSAGVTIVDDVAARNGKAIRIPAGEYLEIADNDLFTLDASAGFTIECRVKFVTNPPTSVSGGTQPFVSHWRQSDNQRSWWVGMSNDDYLIQLSTDGTNTANENADEDTLGVGTFYDFSFIMAQGLPASFGTTNIFYHRDGANGQSDVSGVNSLHNSSAPLRIGADPNGNTIDCIIEEIRIVDGYLRAGTGGYTVETVPFWGRERLKTLHVNWEKHADGVTTGITTDDLNRMSVTIGNGGSVTTQVDDAQSKFGTKSLFCGGFNSATTPQNIDGCWIEQTDFDDPFNYVMEFNTEDFTIECFVRFAALPSTNPSENAGMALVAMAYRTGVAPWVKYDFRFPANNTLYFLYADINNNTTTISSAALTLAIDTWYHVAAVRKNGVMSLYFDGNRVAQELTSFAGLDMQNHSGTLGPLTLGRHYIRNSATRHAALNGWLDEVRIQRGTAEYDGATYTVPTAAFPVDPAPAVAPPPPVPEGNNWQPTNL